MGIFDNDKKKDQQSFGLFNFIKEQSDNNSEFTEEEMDVYGLTDYQKELVKKGENNPWDFEEEDLEDDDYYNEDDE